MLVGRMRNLILSRSAAFLVVGLHVYKVFLSYIEYVLYNDWYSHGSIVTCHIEISCSKSVTSNCSLL